MRFVTIRVIGVFVAIVACAIGCRFSILAADPEPIGTQIDFPAFWKKFKSAVASGDKSAVGEMTKFPLSIKRFAINYGQGRTHATSLYQLRGNEWKALKLPDDEDKILQRVDDIVAGQLKWKGLSKEKLSKKGMYLRLIWWTVQLDRWVDPNTAILYASLRQVAARRDDPGEMSDGFGADLLFTLKFDEAGNWKIIKTHEMSEKEAEKREKEQ
jgi:hypothetical protein